MNVRVLGCAAVAALMVLAASTRASAQSNDEVFPQFQFNFSTPGARANAMGGTFIGIADDSSASITNPAGLVRLTRKQVYFEFKATSLEVDRLSAVDSLFTLEPTTSGETTSTPAFLSFSMPVGERFAVAFTRHQFLNYREDFTLAPRPIPLSGFVFFGVDGETDFSAVSYAVSAAMTVNPKLRVGVTLSRDSMSANSVATRFAHESTDSNDQFALRQLPLIVNETSIDDSASGMSATFGALILPNEKVSIGVQFAKGASFELEESLRQNPSDDVNDPLEMVEGFPKTVTIHVPNRFGIGIAVRPTPRLLASVDVVRIGYSSLAKDFTVIFSDEVLDSSNFEVDNVTEVHAGAEYLLVPGDRRLFVRAGVFSSPSHATRFLPGSDFIANASQEAKYNLLPRDTDVVGSFGIGAAVGPRFQADFAYVIGREFVASVGVRF